MSEHRTLYAALVAALGALTDVVRSSTADAGTYKYRYAELADVLAVARPVLATNGLALLTLLECDDRTVTVRARFLHDAGGMLEAGELTMARGATAQATGSAITYARRYLVMAALNLATEDDDGQEATATPQADPDRVFAVEVFERLKALDAGQREAFDVWRGEHAGKLTVPALTRDRAWAHLVLESIENLEESTP